MKLFRIRKEICIRQQSAEDCAAACLCTVFKYYGGNISIKECRNYLHSDKDGTSLLNIKNTAIKLGFECIALQASSTIVDEFNKLKFPAIIYWKGFHFVVLYGIRNSKFVISDPSIGIYHIDREEFLNSWKGNIILLLEPNNLKLKLDKHKVKAKRFILKHILEYSKYIYILIPVSIITGFLSLAPPLVLKYLIDHVIVKSNPNLIFNYIVFSLILIVLNCKLQIIQSLILSSFSEKVQRSLKLIYGHQILNLPISFHETHRSGSIIHKLSSISQINSIISSFIVDFPVKLFIGLISLIIILIYNIYLFFIIFLICIFIVIFIFTSQSNLYRKMNNSLRISSNNYGILTEIFHGAYTLKTLSYSSIQLWKEIQVNNNNELDSNLSVNKIYIYNNIITKTIIDIGTVIILWQGSLLVFNEEITLGILFAIYALKDYVFEMVDSLINIALSWNQTSVVFTHLTDLFDSHLETDTSVELNHIDSFPSNPEIKFVSLNFSYQSNNSFLENLSLSIPKNRIVALVGKSGCGKSTIAKLMTKMYLSHGGDIQYDNYSINSIPLASLRRNVVLVPQECFFLQRTIFDNFKLSDPSISKNEVIKVCKILGVHNFISTLPEQYETVLGVCGAKLSHGQKQRIAIARSLLNNPPIIILDESTSNLDLKTEKDILKRLLSYRRGKTTILITHRKTVQDHANWLIHIENGTLIYNGPNNSGTPKNY